MKTRSIMLSLCLGLTLPQMVPAAYAAGDEAVAYRHIEADALLATDRAFGQAASQQNAPDGLGTMFAPDVIFTSAAGGLFRGRDAVVAAIAADPALAGGRVSWQPVRGGISADGQQGFSFGFMTNQAPGGKTRPFKYLAYWVKRPEGWRVAGYKYARRPEGEGAQTLMAPILPKRAVTYDPAGGDRHAESLAAAEKGFSDEAHAIGIAAAFARNGGPDSMNMGRKTGFTIGSDAIAHELFGPPQPGSPFEWSSDGVLVASSGDLGLSWGAIRLRNANPPQSMAFFTIWRRDGPEAPWRYIAE